MTTADPDLYILSASTFNPSTVKANELRVVWEFLLANDFTVYDMAANICETPDGDVDVCQVSLGVTSDDLDALYPDQRHAVLTPYDDNNPTHRFIRISDEGRDPYN